MKIRGLIVKSPYIDEILEGKKRWEIRGRNTRIRGKIALIKSGTGMVFGTVNIIDSREITFEEYLKWKESRGYKNLDKIVKPYKKIYAWVLDQPVMFEQPISYIHPSGAVIWVKLENYNL